MGQREVLTVHEFRPVMGFHICTPSTTPQEDAVTVAAMNDQDDVSSYVKSSVFEVGEEVAFRGADGLPFNLSSVIHNVSLRSLGPRSRVRRDFLVETARDDDNINIFAIP